MMSWPDRERIRVLIIRDSRKRQASSFKLQASSFKLQASSFKLQAMEFAPLPVFNTPSADSDDLLWFMISSCRL
jgi:hypothetical protein